MQEDDYVSFGDVIGKNWDLVKRIISALPYVFSGLCNYSAVFLFRLFFFVLPIYLIYLITLPLFILFPLSTIFLLRVIKTEPDREAAPPQSRGLLANRMVSSLQTFRFWLTSEVTQFVENKMIEVFKGVYASTSDFFV